MIWDVDSLFEAGLLPCKVVLDGKEITWAVSVNTRSKSYTTYVSDEDGKPRLNEDRTELIEQTRQYRYGYIEAADRTLYV